MVNSLLAYLDPGSGSVLVQVLLGGVAGVAVALRLLRHRISGLFRRRQHEETTSTRDGA